MIISLEYRAYILVHTLMYEFHQRTDLYMPVRTRTYGYIRAHAVPYPLKKIANRSRTHNLLHTLHSVNPCPTGVQNSMPVKIRYDVKVYIICFCQSPCPCTWLLMTNRRRRSRRAGHYVTVRVTSPDSLAARRGAQNGCLESAKWRRTAAQHRLQVLGLNGAPAPPSVLSDSASRATRLGRQRGQARPRFTGTPAVDLFGCSCKLE